MLYELYMYIYIYWEKQKKKNEIERERGVVNIINFYKKLYNIIILYMQFIYVPLYYKLYFSMITNVLLFYSCHYWKYLFGHSLSEKNTSSQLSVFQGRQPQSLAPCRLEGNWEFSAAARIDSNLYWTPQERGSCLNWVAFHTHVDSL